MALVLRNTKGSKLSTEEMDGNLTYLEGLAQQGGDPFPYTGDATIDGTLNIDFTETLQFFSDDDFSAPFGSIYFGFLNNWVDLILSGDFIGTVLTETNHTLYSFTGDGQFNIPSIGLSFPVDVTGDILTVTGGSMSGSTLTSVLNYTDQTGSSGFERYSNQTVMIYVDPVSGDKTQFTFFQSFDTNQSQMSFGKENNAGEQVSLNVNDGATGLRVFSDLSDLDAQIFDISNSDSDKVLEVTGSNIASDTILAHDYADDALAAAGGVPVGGFYHNAGAFRIRLT
jgi:hypothetical protein